MLAAAAEAYLLSLLLLPLWITNGLVWGCCLLKAALYSSTTENTAAVTSSTRWVVLLCLCCDMPPVKDFRVFDEK